MTASNPAASRASASSGHLGTLLTWMLVSLLGVCLVFVVGGFPGIYQVQWRLVTHVLTLALIVGWLVAILWRPDLFVLPRLTLPIAVLLGAMVVSTLASPYPRFGWETVLNAAATALVFAAMVTMLARPGLRPRLRFTAAALVVGIVLAYAVQLLMLWVDFWSTVGRITAPPLRPAFAGLSFGTPNIPAGVVVVFLPLVLAWVHGSTMPPRVRRIALTTLVLIGLFDLIGSGSRGAQLGFAVASVAGAVLLVIDHQRRRGSVMSGNLARARPWMVVVAAAGLVATGLLAGPRLVGRFAETGAEHRLVFWRESLGAFADSPIAGTGPGTWAFAHWAYRAPDQPLDVVAHAHNVVIQLAAEMGMIGLIGAAVVLIGLIGLLRRAWFAMPRSEVIAVSAGLAGLVAQSMVDNFSDLPLYVGGVAFLVAWLEGGVARPSGLERARTRLAAGVGLALLTVVATFIVLPWDRASASYVAGVAAQDSGDWATAQQRYSDASELDTGYPFYRGALGIAEAHLGDTVGAARDLADAGASLGDPFFTVQAALLLASDDGADRADAVRYLVAATSPGYVNIELALDAGRTAELLGRHEDAVDFYATALALDPDLAASGYWSASGRPVAAVQQFEAAIERSTALAGADINPALSAVRLWSQAGDFDRALAVVASIPEARVREIQRDLVGAMSGDNGALIRLKAMAARDPLGPAVVAVAMAANAVGDPDADRYRHWLAFLAAGSDRAGRTAVIVGANSSETALYSVVNPGIAEQVYLRDRGIVTQVPAAPQVAYR